MVTRWIGKSKRRSVLSYSLISAMYRRFLMVFKQCWSEWVNVACKALWVKKHSVRIHVLCWIDSSIHSGASSVVFTVPLSAWWMPSVHYLPCTVPAWATTGLSCSLSSVQVGLPAAPSTRSCCMAHRCHFQAHKSTPTGPAGLQDSHSTGWGGQQLLPPESETSIKCIFIWKPDQKGHTHQNKEFHASITNCATKYALVNLFTINFSHLHYLSLK